MTLSTCFAERVSVAGYPAHKIVLHATRLEAVLDLKDYKKASGNLGKVVERHFMAGGYKVRVYAVVMYAGHHRKAIEPAGERSQSLPAQGPDAKEEEPSRP